MIEPSTGAPWGARYPVPGGAMWLHRSGTGGPAVVFLPGGGMFGLHYWQAHELLTEFTTSVLLDRLGTGWSEPAELPRDGLAVTDDLRALLRAAAIPGPYLLVGHSLGGLHARLFARRFPAEVAGLVLLDPTHEDILDRLPAEAAQRLRAFTTEVALPAEQLDALRTTYRGVFAKALADWPAEIREPLLEKGFSAEGYRRSFREPMNLTEVFEQVRAAGSESAAPMTILSATGVDAFAEELIPPAAKAAAAEASRARHQLYADLAAAHPRGELRPLDAGHSGLAWTHPHEVVRAVRDTISAARA